MTVQREDIEPETSRATTSDWRREPGFTMPERRAWYADDLGRDFLEAWGRDEKGRPDPEHAEGVGPTGSGKTYAICTMLQDRVRVRKSGAVLICTKPADRTVRLLGWPVTDSLDEAQDRKWRAFVYWPRTRRMGTERKAYHEARISDLLHRLWKPDANIIVTFDEVGYVESLSGDMRALVQQYWREGRSQGITVVASKQRPQGALRDMHSETYWTFAFPPKDRSDTERFAELFGAKRDWVPVLDNLDREKREFVIRHARTREAYITWIDRPLRPVKQEQAAPRWLRGGHGAGA